MTKEQRSEAIDLAWERMEWAQMCIQMAETKKEKVWAEAMFEAFWAIYLLLTEQKRKGGG